jgi:hypothetical protein
VKYIGERWKLWSARRWLIQGGGRGNIRTSFREVCGSE